MPQTEQRSTASHQDPAQRRAGTASLVTVALLVVFAIAVGAFATRWWTGDESGPATGGPTTTPTAATEQAYVVEPGQAGPFRIGSDAHDLAAAGLVVADPDEACGNKWRPVADFYRTGLTLSFRLGRSGDDLDQVFIKDPDGGGHSRYHTAEGARVGWTLAQLKDAYGDRLQHHRWAQEDGIGPSDTYTLFGPVGALTFDFGGPVSDPSAPVVALVVTGAPDLAHLDPPDLGC